MKQIDPNVLVAVLRCLPRTIVAIALLIIAIKISANSFGAGAVLAAIGMGRFTRSEKES
jgi:hypothetical protein